MAVLARGYLAEAPATLLFTATVPVSMVAIVLVNKDTVTRTINLYHGIDGVNYRITPVNMSLRSKHLGETEVAYSLDAGNEIRGDCSKEGIVDFIIYGKLA